MTRTVHLDGIGDATGRTWDELRQRLPGAGDADRWRSFWRSLLAAV